MILSLILLVIAALLDLVAAVGSRAEYLSHGQGSAWVLPSSLYAAAALALATTAVLRWTGATGPMRIALLVGLVLSLVAPLVFGRAIEEFHLSHHLVRLVILLVVGVIVWLA